MGWQSCAVHLPCIGQFFSGTDGLQTLIDPLRGIAFLGIDVERALDGQFRVDDFLDAFPPDHCQP